MTKYPSEIESRFENPTFAGFLDQRTNLKSNVYAGLSGNPVEGIFSFQIEVTDEVIKKIRFKVHGCGVAIAVADYLCEQMLNKSTTYLNTISIEKIIEELQVPTLKVSAVVLAKKALEIACTKSKVALKC